VKRRWSLAAVVTGVLIGYLLPVVADPSPQPPAPNPPMPTMTAGAATSAGVTATAPSVATTTTGPPDGIYLVWATGGLPPNLVAGLLQSFDRVSVVKGDVVELSAEPGMVIPLDAVALSPGAHALFDSGGELDLLEPGSVVLGQSSALLRGLEAGDSLRLEGSDFLVAATVGDDVIGAAEVAFDAAEPRSPVSTDRYALVSSDLPRQQFEDLVRGLYDGPAPLRIRTRGETPWLRHGDAVLPQVFIKAALGEFSYRRSSESTFVQDQAFIDAKIETTRVPLLGEVRCHRVVIDMLVGVMSELVEQGLSHLVDPSGFGGCWLPRFIRPAVGVSSGVSRHAWGAAVDLNAGSNPVGSSGNQDPRLIEAMKRWGFTWGGDWLVPDPMHFEFAAEPRN
jgi:hypothetical protein